MLSSSPGGASGGIPAGAPTAPGREWLVALSFANLLYLKTWDAILDSDGNIVPTVYLVAIVNVLLLAALLWCAYVLVWRSGNQWVKGGSLLVLAALLLVPFHAIANIYFSEEVSKRNWVYAAALVAAGAILASRRVRVSGWHLLRILAPVVIVTFGQCVWRAVTYDGTRWLPPAPLSTGAAHTPRLIWMIFDEWDYGLTFDPRPEWLRTPELDRLNAVSFHASQAVSPGAETDISIPRLLTGDMATRGIGDVRTRPTIFSRAKAEGLRPAVAAWYIDYCNVFSPSLDACWSTLADPERNSMGAGPAEIAANQARYLFETTYRSPFGQSVGTKRHILDFGFVTRGALEAVASPALDVVFVHFPIPHPPLFYDRTTRRYDLGDTPLAGLVRMDAARYFDGIELVDQSIGRVRQALESADMWDRTHLIISSDHSARNRERIRDDGPDRRVPFIVHVAGASNEIAYGAPFNTVVSSDLAMALLRGDVQTTAQVRAFIDDRVTPSTGSRASGSAP